MKRKKFKNWCAKLRGEEPVVDSRFWYNKDNKSSAMPVDAFEVNYVLEGMVDRLVHAFEWKFTPQRHDYWSRIHSEQATLTQEDIEYLRWMVRTYA